MEKRKGDHRYVSAGILLSCTALLLASAGTVGSEPAVQTTTDGRTTAATLPHEITVALSEIPVWELANEWVRQSFLRGQHAPVHPIEKERLLGMQFVSDAPLYGQVSFLNPASGSRQPECFYFAADTLRRGGDYDLLYFDGNGHADLSDVKPRKPARQLDRLTRRIPSVTETFFEPVTAMFLSEPGGPQALELLPCLRIYEGGSPQFSFVAARVHTGTFELGGTSYQAFLGYQYMITGRLDQPSTALLLLAQGNAPITWSGGDRLNATHLLGGRYYHFSCTPAGDKLTVQPYTGPLGVFEISPGSRKVSTLTMRGALCSATTAVGVGSEPSRSRPPESARSCKLPVGDYRISNLFVQVDGLSALVLNNYHADGKPMGGMERLNTSGIAIRADKPFVLTFSESGQVLFAAPVRDQRIRRGEELNIKAVLIDPALNVMFRVLTHGQQLDPKVVIKRANGEMVAEGTMPFG